MGERQSFIPYFILGYAKKYLHITCIIKPILRYPYVCLFVCMGGGGVRKSNHERILGYPKINLRFP